MHAFGGGGKRFLLLIAGYAVHGLLQGGLCLAGQADEGPAVGLVGDGGAVGGEPVFGVAVLFQVLAAQGTGLAVALQGGAVFASCQGLVGGVDLPVLLPQYQWHEGGSEHAADQ